MSNSKLIRVPSLTVNGGLLVRLDAALGITLGVSAQAGTVIAWADQSGNGNHFVSSNPTSNPTVLNNVINGNPVINFGTNASNGILVNDSISHSATAWTFIFVSSLTDIQGQEASRIMGGIRFAGGVRWAFNMGKSIDDGFGYAGAGGSSMGAGEYVAQNTFRIRTYLKSASRWKGLSNGREFIGNFSDASNPTSPMGMSLGTESNLNPGNEGAAAQCLRGNIAEVLIYSRELTDSERQEVELYLRAKYGI